MIWVMCGFVLAAMCVSKNGFVIATIVFPYAARSAENMPYRSNFLRVPLRHFWTVL